MSTNGGQQHGPTPAAAATGRWRVHGSETLAEAMQAKVLTTDEARRIAVNIARFPERHRWRVQSRCDSALAACQS